MFDGMLAAWDLVATSVRAEVAAAGVEQACVVGSLPAREDRLVPQGDELADARVHIGDVRARVCAHSMNRSLQSANGMPSTVISGSDTTAPWVRPPLNARLAHTIHHSPSARSRTFANSSR